MNLITIALAYRNNPRPRYAVPCPQCGLIRIVRDRARALRRSCHRCGTAANPAAQSHGESRTRLYGIWIGMRERCGHIPGATPTTLKRYRDRGIRVCDEWQDYLTFASWARSNGYRDDLTIDRIEGAGHYEPGNCRWATYAEQRRNSGNMRLSVANVSTIKNRLRSGERVCDIARDYGVSHQVVYWVKSGRTWRDVA